MIDRLYIEVQIHDFNQSCIGTSFFTKQKIENACIFLEGMIICI